MKHKYYLSLGSNLGDRKNYLLRARNGLFDLGHITNASAIVETKPFGVADALFLNQVVECTSRLDPATLLDALKSLEQKLGRKPREHWGNREIDIDIILWDGEKLDTVTPLGRSLILPHPGLSNRAFLRDLLQELQAPL